MRVIRSLAWQGQATLAGQMLSWAASVVVIRLLDPTDYGLMASAGVLLGLIAAISELGVGAAVVQARELDRTRLRDLQTLVLILAFGGALVTAACGPALARFFSEPRLAELAPALALTLPLAALYMLPQSLALRDLSFDQKAIADVSAALVTAAFTLGLALQGAGVWALVGGVMGGHVARIASYAVLQRTWIWPSWSIAGAFQFVRFGMLASVDRLIWFLLTSVDLLILGRLCGEEILGEYVVALTLASLPLEKIAPLITQVSFSAFAQIQGDPRLVRRSVVTSLRFGAFAFIPLSWGAALIAPAALPIVLGETWGDIVLPFQMLCIVLPLRALSVLVTPALFGTGRVDLNISNLIVSLVVMAGAFFVGARHGLEGASWAWLLAYPIVFLITQARALRALDVSLVDVRRACMSSVAAGLLLVGAVTGVGTLFPGSPELLLALGIPLGALIYLGGIRLIDPELIDEIRALISSGARPDDERTADA
ncbi:MAG: oligosaccharide flippase family protein [Deltaproteobacteria bacterium]|nr:oligosaccharide flippase family protein [Deltaproteobacteria bacterium]